MKSTQKLEYLIQGKRYLPQLSLGEVNKSINDNFQLDQNILTVAIKSMILLHVKRMCA